MSRLRTQLDLNGSEGNPSDRRIAVLSGGCPAPTRASTLPCLLNRLREVMQIIEQVQTENLPSHQPPEGSECWTDDDYTYIEAMFPELAEASIDINVFEGRVLIRALR